MTIEDELMERLRRIHSTTEELRRHVHFRSKPLLGGCWGAGAFSLFSYAATVGALDYVFYFVAVPDLSAVLAGAESKSEAISLSRTLLSRIGLRRLLEFSAATREAKLAAERASMQSRTQEKDVKEKSAPNASGFPRIPRRRRAVFEASAGKCHYCGKVLDLTGKWHVEHKMPRALMGTNEPSNLVASCIPCNMKKRDRTDLEFIAARGAP